MEFRDRRTGEADTIALCDSPTATTGPHGLGTTQSHGPSYVGIAGKFSIAWIEGVATLAEYRDLRILDRRSHPCVKDAYVNPPAKVETFRLTCQIPAPILETLCLHMVSSCPRESPED